MADDGAPEAMLFFVALIPDALKLVEVVLDQGKEVVGAGVSRPINCLRRALHIVSNRSSDCVAKMMLAGFERAQIVQQQEAREERRKQRERE
jgi:hypothetical protein